MKAREFDRDTAKARRIFRSLLLAGILIMTALIVLKLAPLHTSALPGVVPIRSIEVSGSRLIQKRQIVQLLGPGVSGSLLLFNVNRASASLLEDPRIMQVEMAKLYPDTLRVWIREKAPGAFFAARAGRDAGGPDNTSGGSESTAGGWLVSYDGTVLAPVGSAGNGAPPGKYPRITLIDDSVDIYTGAVVRDLTVLDLLRAVRDLSERHPRFVKNIDEFRVDGDGVTALVNGDRMRVYLGPLVDPDKLERLRALTFVLNDQYGTETVFDVDMSFSHAAVRERER